MKRAPRAIPRMNYTKRFCEMLLSDLSFGNAVVHALLTPNAYKSKCPPVDVIFQSTRGAFCETVDPWTLRGYYKWGGRSVGVAACMGYELALRRRLFRRKIGGGGGYVADWVFVKVAVPKTNGRLDQWQWMKGA